MKKRFITAISLLFVVAHGLLSFLQFHYFEKERLHLIDQQIERTAQLLASSDLSYRGLASHEELEEAIFGLLEEEPPNQILQLRSRQGKVLYRNLRAEALGAELNEGPGFRFEEVRGRTIRYATYPVPAKKVVLQVGLVLDQRGILWEGILWKVLGFSALAVLGFVALSALLTNYLLRPLKELALFLKYQATESGSEVAMPALMRESNEFRELGESVRNVTERWQSLLSHHSSMLARLVHEIRTPLTVIRNRLEKSPADLGGAREELGHLESLTGEFMAWAKLEVAPDNGRHAIGLKGFAEKFLESWPEPVESRISMDPGWKLFARPEHLRLVLENFLSNAARYGEPGKPVKLVIEEGRLEVRSWGPELPQRVLDNLGKPFNRGGEHPGSTGIGLANVKSVCRKYDWRMEYIRQEEENRFRILF